MTVLRIDSACYALSLFLVNAQQSRTGLWPKRKWETRLGQPMVGNATDFWSVSVLRDRPLLYFLTAKDERGAIVSTEHKLLDKP